ncbi:MAG: ROK family transcriptional regulator [Bifidobacteriaceae bacterium]|nr:ROK family transcriptional regulator [Bifidobacteriaceae bacterium]
MPSVDASVSPRERTREAVYRIIRMSPGITRSGLATVTGLSGSTVSHAVARLIAEGRVAEGAVEERRLGAGPGRPATTLAAVATGEMVGAMDFGHAHVNVAIGDGLGQLIAREHLEIDTHILADEAMDLAAQRIADLQATHGGRLAAIVAGAPAHVDRRSGIVASTVQSRWLGRAPAGELSRRLGQSVNVENDAVLGAYGELISGAGRGHADFCYVKVGHGIGAGLVVGGRLYRGGVGLGGQVGHARVPERSDLCRCGGRGCLEAVVSVSAIEARLAVAHAAPTAPIAGPASFDDAVSKRILAEAGATLGEALAPVCNLLNPTALIIGGGLGASSTDFLEGAAVAVERYTQPGIAATVEVLGAELGELAELTGALRLASRLALR